jgi:glutamine synthetase
MLMDIDQVKEICSEHILHTVECVYPDAHGIARGKRVPVRFFTERGYEGFDIANVSLVWDRKCDILDNISYASWETGYPDMKVVPDLSTFRPVPWRRGAAAVICDCVDIEDRSPVRVSTRQLLKDLIAEARAMGFEPMFGSELEFYVLDQNGVPIYPDVACYSLDKGALLEGLLEHVRRELDDFGIQIEACNTEYGPAQVEVNIRYADALTTADRTMLFKMGVRDIATQHGYKTTFMAKPFADESGSGHHLHQSLTRLETEQNLWDDCEHEVTNPLMRHYLAGLLEHMIPFTALCAPTVNAYKRVKGYTFAPMNVSWSIDNRTVGIRALVGLGAGNRLEWRHGAADANPYLAIAANLAAGLDGIRQRREPPEMVKGDAYRRDDLPVFPQTLDHALDALGGSELARTFLGDFLDVFIALGRHEVGLWRSAVTDWERDRYFEA